MSERIYTINERQVSAETFAAIVSDLFAAGWTLTPPSTPTTDPNGEDR